MKRGSIIFLKAAVFTIGIVTLCLCLFALPQLASYTVEMYPEFGYLKYPVLIGVYLTALPFFFALYQAYKLLRYIESNLAFSASAVLGLSRIKLCAASIITLYGIGMVILASQSALHPGIAIIGFVIIFTTMVIFLFTAVLQELLKNVITIKSENDLTV